MAVIVPIDADVSGLTRKLGAATNSLSGFGKMAALAAGAAAFGGLVATVKIGVDEFMQAEKVTAQTNAVLKSTGGIANVTKKQIDDLATSIMRKSGMDDEAVKSAQNLLLTFTNVRNEAGKGNDVFNQATQITADLSVAFGKDLNSSAILVGKALNDPVKGLSALSRVGIQFSEDQKKTIKALVESGDTMQAQKLILKELETQVGGSAAAYGETLSGKLNIARETFRNMAADLVSAFMPAIANAATVLGRFVSQLASQPTLRAKIDFVLESASEVAARFWNWWSQPSMEKVRSPTSGVIVKFNKPGSQQVEEFINGIDLAVRAKAKEWAGNLGYSIPGWIFGGVKRNTGDSGASLLVTLLKWSNPPYVAVQMAQFGADIATAIWEGIRRWFDDNPGVAAKKIKEWLTSAGDTLDGAAKSVVDSVTGALGKKLRSSRLLDRATVAKVLTDDMKAAIQGARNGLVGAASSLASMFNQIVSATLRVDGGPDAAESLSQARELEDRRFAIQEDQLKKALAATEEGSADQVQAKLDLDQLYFDRNQVLRQRAIDDEQKTNQQSIDNLVTRFNKGLISATEFSNELDKIIGAERGASLGEAFAFAFGNALQSVKNAAADIFNIVGQGLPQGPEIGAVGPATLAATAAYNDALVKWQDQRQKLSDRLKSLRDKANDRDSPGGTTITAAEKTRIDKAREALEDWVAKKPKKSDYGLAAGGILTGPRYLAGEAGNEAVIPLSSPTAAEMMRKAFASTIVPSGDTVYNISINAGVGSDPNELGRVVVQAIKTYERKNGPVFVGV